MSSYTAIQKPFPSKKNTGQRIQCVLTHKNRTREKWSHVMFTDETSFFVRPMSNRLRVLRRNGTRMHQGNIVPTSKSSCQVVNVLGGSSTFARTPYVGTCINFNQDTYRGITDNYVLPCINAKHGRRKSFILQEDNCGPHTARSIATLFHQKGVNRMKWPAQSADLNPIENICCIMKSKLWKRNVHPK